MTDDLTLLASAYLDGDVTADERARVESSPALLAEVDRLRSVAALVADVEPAPISIREQHLAGALDAWDRLPDAERQGVHRDMTPRAIERGIDAATLAAASSITAPSRSSADQRRATMNRRLLGAAAAIVVVLGGGIALQTVTGDSNDDSSEAQVLDAPEAASRAEAPGTGDGQDDVTAAEAADSDGATGDTLLDTGVLDAAPPPDRQLEQLDGPDQLAYFAGDAVGAPTAPDVPAATSGSIDDLLTESESALLDAEVPLCLGADTVVGPALYRGVEVVVAIDEGRDIALAYRPLDCVEIARVRLP